MTKFLLPLALLGSLVVAMPQLAMGQGDVPGDMSGSFSIDQFHESYNGELKELAEGFLDNYVQPQPLVASASTGDDLDPCQVPGSITVADYCASVTNDGNPYYVWCKALYDTNLIFRYANRNRKFTLFVPTKDAFVTYYTEVARRSSIPHEELVPILEYHDLEGTVYEPDKLWCKRKYVTSTNLIPGGSKPPKIVCQSDIAGNPVTFLRGSDKPSQKVFTPQFENPSEPLRVCNANIYAMSNLVLYKEKTKRVRNRNKNKNKNQVVVTAPVDLAVNDPDTVPVSSPVEPTVRV